MKKFSLVFSLLLAFVLVGCMSSETPVEEDADVVSTSEETQDMEVTEEEEEVLEMAGDEMFPGASASYEVDTEKSVIEWEACKVTGCHNGGILVKEGMIVTDENSMIEDALFVIDMQSITVTDLEGGAADSLRNHLVSDDFFGVESYPVATLEIEEIEALGDGEYKAEGVFEMKGIKNEVEFEFTMESGNTSTQRMAVGGLELDRTLWDVRYGSGKFFDNLGDGMIDDIFTLNFDVVLQAS